MQSERTLIWSKLLDQADSQIQTIVSDTILDIFWNRSLTHVWNQLENQVLELINDQITYDITIQN